LIYQVTGTGKNAETTEIININENKGSSLDIGYVFGGIEAFESNPGRYGQSKSRASNKIWKVTLSKK
jgi:hypothetical protein